MAEVIIPTERFTLSIEWHKENRRGLLGRQREVDIAVAQVNDLGSGFSLASLFSADLGRPTANRQVIIRGVVRVDQHRIKEKSYRCSWGNGKMTIEDPDMHSRGELDPDTKIGIPQVIRFSVEQQAPGSRGDFGPNIVFIRHDVKMSVTGIEVVAEGKI